MSVAAFAWPSASRAENATRPASTVRKAAGPFELEARPGTAPLRGETKGDTPIWGYNGAVPGPALRVKHGEELRVRFTNGLPEPTLIHWHGVRAPDAADGVPHLTQEPLASGGSREIVFAPPDAGTYWYHAHPIFAGQADRGLYGALLVEEAEPVAADQDIMLLLDDWRLDPNGAVSEVDGGREGIEHLTVNGRPGVDFRVRANERLRLRLINASRDRTFGLRVEGHRPVVMAIDGQPAEPFAARDGRVALAPGNRVDLFVDAAQAAGSSAAVLLDTGAAPVPIARLAYAEGAPLRPEPLPPPGPLPANALPGRMDLAKALRVTLPMGGKVAAPTADRKGGTPSPPPVNWLDPAAVKRSAPLFTVGRGRPVVLALANASAATQLFHLHNQPFRLLDRLDDGWKPFWLDTFPVEPGQTARIAFVPEGAGRRMLQTRPLGEAAAAAFFWYAVN